MARRFGRPAGPVGSEYITAANITSGAAHTLGAWGQVDASVARDVMGFYTSSSTVIGVSATNTNSILEIGFGASTAEVMQVRFFVGGHDLSVPIYVPLHIPAGTRLAMRWQSAVASDIYTPNVLLLFAPGLGFGGFSGGTALGLNNATSGPTTADLTDNAYDEIIASTAEPYKAITVHGGINAGAATAGTISLSLGIGAAASEQELGQWIIRTATSEISSTNYGPIPGICPPGGIPTGSRLAIRKNSTVDATAHLVGWY